MKRFWAILLAALLSVSCAHALADETAVDMRLEAYSGEASITNADGRSLTVRNLMKLFNGYTLATAEKSYLWMSLDQAKALKLDAASSARLNKAGERLKVELLSGNLLCEVRSPLRDEEVLEIETSTTVTGIRGTVLIVRVLDEYTSEIVVLEGCVTVTERDPDSEEIRQITVWAGQVALSSAVAGKDGRMDFNKITIRSFHASEADAFLLDEIARSPELVEHLRLSTSEEVRKLLPDERRASGEPKADEGGDAETPAPAPAPGPTYVNVDVTDSSPASVAAFMDALQNNQYLVVTVNTATPFVPAQPVAVAADQTVELTGSRLNMEGNTLNNAGTMNVDATSTLTSTGTVLNTSSNTLNVHGSLDVREESDLSSQTSSVLENTGVLNIYGDGDDAFAHVRELINSGVINILEGGKLVISQYSPGGGPVGDNRAIQGVLTNTGTINIINGALLFGDVASLNNGATGKIVVGGSGRLNGEDGSRMTNDGEIVVEAGGQLYSENLVNTGEVIVEESATLTSTSGLTNDGTLTVEGVVENDGWLNQ